MAVVVVGFFLPSFVFRVFTLGLFVLEPNFLARDQFRPGPGADFFRTDAPLECVPRAAAAGWSVTTGVTTSCRPLRAVGLADRPTDLIFAFRVLFFSLYFSDHKYARQMLPLCKVCSIAGGRSGIEKRFLQVTSISNYFRVSEFVFRSNEVKCRLNGHG